MIKEKLYTYKQLVERRVPYALKSACYRLDIISKFMMPNLTNKYCSKRNNFLYAPFFIIGSARSGTTLLRSLLSEHPDVFIPPENKFRNMIKAFDAYRGLPWRTQVAAVLEEFSNNYEFNYWEVDLCSIMAKAELLKEENRNFAELINLIYTEYGLIHVPGKRRWGDKTPGNAFNLNLIEKIYPNAQYIHMARDGRDCVVSYVKSSFYDGDIVRAAYEWRDSVRACRKFEKRIHDKKRFFELQYEDLVCSPERKVRDVCKFLNLEPTEEMLNYKGASNKINDVFSREHHQNLKRSVFKDSIGKWKQEISESDLRKVLKIIEGELRVFGYM